MKKTKLYYYVLLLCKNFDLKLKNSYTAKYVTKVDNTSKYCEWKEDEKPLAMSKTTAEDIVYGLSLNGYNAIIVNYTYEL